MLLQKLIILLLKHSKHCYQEWRNYCGRKSFNHLTAKKPYHTQTRMNDIFHYAELSGYGLFNRYLVCWYWQLSHSANKAIICWCSQGIALESSITSQALWTKRAIVDSRIKCWQWWASMKCIIASNIKVLVCSCNCVK